MVIKVNKLFKAFVEMISKKPFIVNSARAFFASSFVNDSYLYSRLCNYMAHRYNSTRPFGNLRINIETTLACNAKCIMCSKRSYPLKVGTMSDELYQKIIKEGVEIGVKKAILSVYGEPLMDAKFPQRARFVAKAGVRFSFYTNGSLLNESISRKLLQLDNFSSVNFSINGFSKKTYEEIMVGLDRDKVYRNVLNFLELKEKLNPEVFVTISCVLFDKNVHEMNQIKQFWSSQKGVDRVYFPIIRNRGGTQLDIEADGNSVMFSPLTNEMHKLHPCKFLWEDLFIYWNGDVGVCCEDTAARRIIIGNLEKMSLREVWMGEKMKRLRRLHLTGNRKLHRICGKACKYNTIWLKP